MCFKSLAPMAGVLIGFKVFELDSFRPMVCLLDWLGAWDFKRLELQNVKDLGLSRFTKLRH